MSKLTLQELRSKGRKKCWSKSQKFWLEISLYLTAPLARTSITPNMISVSWIIIQVIAAILLIFGEYKLNLLAIFLFNFVAYIGDHMDGNLARMNEKYSNLGPYLEQLALFLGTPLIFIGLALGNFTNNKDLFLLSVSLFGVLLWLLEKLARINPIWFDERQRDRVINIYRKKVSFRSKKGWKKFLIELTRRGQPFNLLFFLIIFGLPQTASMIYSFLFTLEFLRKLYSTCRNLKKLDREKI